MKAKLKTSDRAPWHSAPDQSRQSLRARGGVRESAARESARAVGQLGSARDAIACGGGAELDDLELGDEALPRHGKRKHPTEVVIVHDHVHGRVEEQAPKLQRLYKLEPRPRHQEDDCVVVGVEEKVRRRTAL